MISAKVQAVRARLADAARRAGRLPDSIRLIGVTKTASVEQIREAIAAGVTELGENRVQVARPKIAALGRRATWHLIGSLQRNKVRAALDLFDWIHSVDRLELAQELERQACLAGRQAAARGRVVPVLIQVNSSGEPTKHGIAPEALGALLDGVRSLTHLQVRGLMTMAPIVERPEATRSCFRAVRQLAEQFHLPELSMGMSQDFEVAVEEGATMVRIGTAIFG